jgi:acyl dehydratase
MKTPEPGFELPPFVVEAVDPAAMAAWAPILRDPNPIHLDRAAVQAAGLGDRRINQGPINLGYVMTMLGRAFPGARIADLRNRFSDNVFEGERVETTGRVTAVEGGTVTCDFAVETARGAALTGTAVLELPGRQRP